jgi:tRNA-2-methylthio-N6-dimethylallyladenosine synthase
VPYVRGPERSRQLEDVVREVEALLADGVLEVTLLGQNVNSYGRDLYGEPRFAEMLAAVAATGVPRVRFATSHPKDLSDATIEVMASSPNVCKALHLPVQSGSDRILAAMNRRYTQAGYLALVGKLYAAMPSLALSTDIIVGFPGETEQDFAETLRVVREARFDQAFTFIYSPRTGTPAADMPGRVAREVAQERFDRLVAEVQAQASAKSAALVGAAQRVLVEGASKRDADTIAGRTEGNRVVHAPVPGGMTAEALAGTFVDVEVLEAHTWFVSGRIEG